jgi:RNA polymerase-binding transcription factor DksA
VDEKDFEIAAQLELLERESAINKARKGAVTQMPPPDFDGTCPLCGAEIPLRRVAIKYYVCVDCVAEQEQRNKLQAG